MNTLIPLVGLSKCEECPLYEGANVVEGVGPKPANIMLIGEAPGALEDELGEPFVGASGAKLEILLEQAGLHRDNINITNLVKHRPPRNRNP